MNPDREPPRAVATTDVKPRVGVYGLGSVLMRDDGAGPVVVRRLRAAYRFPPAVEVRDLGTPGPHLGLHLADREAIILIDAIRCAGRPGDLRLLRRADLDRAAEVGAGPHDPGLGEALATLAFCGRQPRVLLVGVVPATVGPGTELSPEVTRSLPAAEREVLAELARLGHRAAPRSDPRPPDLWWRRP